MPDLPLATAEQELAKREIETQEIAIPLRGLWLSDCDGNGIVLVERRLPEDTRPAETPRMSFQGFTRAAWGT